MFEFLQNKLYLLVGVCALIVLTICYFKFFKKNQDETYVNVGDSSPSDTTNEKNLVLYYSPKCGHCRDFMEGSDSVWNQLIEKYKDSIKISEIDCDENPQMNTENNITKFPTIKLFNGNVIKEYEGNRSMNDLSSFIESS